MDTYTQFERDDLTITAHYDHDADSPFSWGWEGLAIAPYERNSVEHGDTELINALTDNDEERETLTLELDQSVEDWRDALDHYDEVSAGLGIRYDETDERDARIAYHHALEGLTDSVNALKDLDNNRPELVSFEWCPYVDLIRYFQVVYNPVIIAKEWGIPMDAPKAIHARVKDLVSTFNVWYRGGTLVLTVERDGEYLDTLAGVMLDDDAPTDEELWQFVTDNMVVK